MPAGKPYSIVKELSGRVEKLFEKNIPPRTSPHDPEMAREALKGLNVPVNPPTDHITP
jgi:hypothetical protein